MSSTSPNLRFQIRPLTEDDYDALIELWRVSSGQYEPNGRESRDAFARQLEMFAGLYLAAVHDGRIVGAVLGTHDHRKGWINRLAVHPEFRGQGVAAALVTTCDTAIRARGISLVAALVELDNAASAAVFRRLGYGELPVLYFRGPSGDNC